MKKFWRTNSTPKFLSEWMDHHEEQKVCETPGPSSEEHTEPEVCDEGACTEEAGSRGSTSPT